MLKKTSNLEASKLSQDILLGGEKEIWAYKSVSLSKMAATMEKRTKTVETEDRTATITITDADRNQLKYHGSMNTPY